MKDMKEFIIKECVQILNRKDIKEEIKDFIKPMITLMVEEIYPYLFVCVIFSITTFLLVLAIFVILLRRKEYNFFSKLNI
jgi:hypothetical protein